MDLSTIRTRSTENTCIWMHSAMSDEEVQNTVMRQLKEQGFKNISVTVTRNENGIRRLQLHPAEDAANSGNYIVDVSMDDKGTRMVLQEEKRTNANRPKNAEGPGVDFGSMTDAQVREYIRRRYGKQLHDDNIQITRTAQEIAINIKLNEKQEEVMRFKLH